MKISKNLSNLFIKVLFVFFGLSPYGLASSVDLLDKARTFAFIGHHQTVQSEKEKAYKQASFYFELSLKNEEKPILTMNEYRCALTDYIYLLEQMDSQEFYEKIINLREQQKKLSENLEIEQSFDFTVPRFRANELIVIPSKVVFFLIKKIQQSPDLINQLETLLDQVHINSLNLSLNEREMLKKILLHWNAKKPERSGIDGSFETNNKFGYNFGFSTVAHKEFAHFSVPQTPDDLKPVIDIGAAYGSNTLLALKEGGIVIATDFDSKLLSVLVQSIPENLLDRLDIHVGIFPQDFQPSPGSIKGVLISNLIHYFEPQEVINGYAKVFNCLQKNGKLYLFSITPLYGQLNDTELGIIEKQISDSFEINKWGDLSVDWKYSFPNYIPNVLQGEYIPHPQTANIASRQLEYVGFTVDYSADFISSSQAAYWKYFKQSSFKVKPRNPIYQFGEVELVMLSARGIDREDFSYYRQRFISHTSEVERENFIEILNDFNNLWPISPNELGGNMVSVATKKADDAVLSHIQIQKPCKFCQKYSLKLMKCSACKKVSYCSKKCQKDDWLKNHKKNCKE